MHAPRALPRTSHGGRDRTQPDAVHTVGGARIMGYSGAVTHLRALREASEALQTLTPGASLRGAVRTLLRAAHHVARVEAARRAEALVVWRRTRPECGARCRDGHPCTARVAWWTDAAGRPVEAARCRMHGGASTGPRTAAGRAASLAALARGREVLRQRREAEAAAGLEGPRQGDGGGVSGLEG
jgi:hypothetical protein